MNIRLWLFLTLPGAILLAILMIDPVQGCCPAPPSGKPVVNADQTVIMIWDAEKKRQHFIRKASFASDADDFGFLVPSPSQPELSESGNEAFGVLFELTKPEVITQRRPSGGSGCIGCPSAVKSRAAKDEAAPGGVKVLQEKLVAGFEASVLETKSTKDLVAWLKKNGYAFSPAVEAWAKPYVEKDWKITALKVAKNKESKEKKDVSASALRMSFETDRPLFPYREPESEDSAKKLKVDSRLLRIYFLAEARYLGELTPDQPWTGKAVWAGKVGEANRKKLLEILKLAETTGPAEWWLTEFEDRWPYESAPADVYFTKDSNQDTLKREPIIRYVSAPWPADVMVYVIAAALVLPTLCRRVGKPR